MSDSSKPCPMCNRWMETWHAWWWTAYGSVCSEGCARDLIREHEGGVHRPSPADTPEAHRD